MNEIEEKKEKIEEKEEKEEKKGKSEPNKKATFLIILAAIAVFVVMLGGVVIKKAKNFVEGDIFSRLTNGRVDIEKDGEKVTVTSEEGEFTFEEEGELPDSFPSDFPVYPGAKLASSWVADGDNTDGLSLIWETEDAVSKVSNYYENELEKAGWTLSITSKTEDSATFSFEKDDARGFIGVTIEESKVIISLTLGV